jgi:putative oxidoreductase
MMDTRSWVLSFACRSVPRVRENNMPTPGEFSAARRGTIIMDATRYLPFAGRLLIALTFFMSGLSKVADYSGTLGLISATKLPLPAPLAYAGAVAVEIVCSVMLIVGFRTRAAAAVLALYCVATAVFFHTNFADPDNIIHFLKNVAMTGGLLQIVGFGAGALSIDNRPARSGATGRRKG